ncbi:MAG: hypothetical protein EON96_15970 [Caulobacteraceae bacterium]|nr:MAG: hypothetical protein EON96_15970 [Caulobacteraceae bacterium]
MNRSQAFAALAMIAATTLPAAASAAVEAPTGAQARPVLVCATDAATRRAFTREHGAAPRFITARQALAIQATDAGWSTPRCMTARQHALYKDAATTFARAR